MKGIPQSDSSTSSLVYLERYEFGKPCIIPDGDVISKGNRPAEYQPLFKTPDFPLDEMLWTEHEQRIEPSSKRDIFIAHTPFVSKKFQSSQWIGITQVHDYRKESYSGSRSYVMSRYSAQSSSTDVPIASRELLSPFATAIAILRDPMIGWTLNPQLDPFYFDTTLFRPFISWSQVQTALNYSLLGIPICILLKEDDSGNISPSLEQFLELADALWYFLPVSLRPWFSWGWNIKETRQGKGINASDLTISASHSPPRNSAVFDFSNKSWIQSNLSIPEIEWKKAKTWGSILSLHKGEQSTVQHSLKGYFTYNNVCRENIPFRRPTPYNEQYSICSTAFRFINIRTLRPVLNSIRETLHGITISLQAERWLNGDIQEFHLNFHRDSQAVREFEKRIFRQYWTIWATDPNSTVPFKTLLELSWKFSSAIGTDFPSWNTNIILDKLPKEASIQAIVGTMFFSTKDIRAQSIIEIRTLLTKLLNTVQTPITQEFMHMLHEGLLPLDFITALYNRLDKFSWPYIELTVPQELLLHSKSFTQVYNAFTEWGTTATIRYSLIQSRVREARKEGYSWIDSPAYPIIELFKRDRPTMEELQASIHTFELQALINYIWTVELQYNKTKSTQSVMILSSAQSWFWDILLTVPKKLLPNQNLGQKSRTRWLYLLREGLTTDILEQVQLSNPVDQKNSVLIWQKLLLIEHLNSVHNCPPPQNEQAWLNIAGICFSYFDPELFKRCHEEIQETILSYFPRPWPRFLQQTMTPGSTHPVHNQWTSPFQKIKGGEVLEKALRTVVSNLENSAFEQDEKIELVRLILDQLQQIGRMNNIPPSLRDLRQFIFQIGTAGETKNSIPVLPSQSIPILENLIQLSPRMKSSLGNIWNNLGKRPANQQSGKETLILFRLLCPNDPLTHRCSLKHIGHLVHIRNTPDSYELIAETYHNIHDQLNILEIQSTDNNDAIQGVRQVLTVLDILMINPQICTISNKLWDPIFSKTLSALCFKGIPVGHLPNQHYVQWRTYFKIDSDLEHLHLDATFVQQHKELPTTKDRYIQKYNSIFRRDRDVNIVFPPPGKSNLPLSQRFEFLMQNWGKLNSKAGFVRGRFPSIQTFLWLRNWVSSITLLTINGVAIFGSFKMTPALQTIIGKNYPQYNSQITMALLGTGILALLIGSQYLKKSLYRYFETIRPKSMKLYTNTEQHTLAVASNIDKKKKHDQTYVHTITPILIPDNDTMEDLQILGTTINWSTLNLSKRK